MTRKQRVREHATDDVSAETFVATMRELQRENPGAFKLVLATARQMVANNRAAAKREGVSLKVWLRRRERAGKMHP